MTKLECINPGEIETGDLMAYLHGDALPQVIEHVTHCVSCTEQVEQLRMVDAQLLVAFYRDACPTAEILAGFALDRLPATERLRVAAHIRDCSACSEEIASVRDLADEEPPSLLARLWESLTHALIVQQVALVGIPTRGQSWQGRFEANDLVVTLTAQANSLTGRVRRRGSHIDADYSGDAWLLSKEAATDDVPNSKIDERGRFHFATLPVSSCTLLLRVGEQDVAIEKIWIE